MKYGLIDQSMIDSVTQHMNEDHADACLVIARTLGKHPEAQAASMTGMDALGIDLLVLLTDSKKIPVRVNFEKPVNRDSQIRGHIVALTKKARSNLGE